MSAWYLMLCVLVLENTVQCLRLEVSPSTIEPEKTESLSLNCTFTSPDLFRMRLLYTLTLSHSFNNNSVDEILATARLNSKLLYTQGKDGLASGGITSKSGSYLRYQLHFPYYHHAGHYKCQANGIGLDGRRLTLKAQANVSCREMSLKTLSEDIRVLRLESIHFAKVLTRHEETFSEMDRIQAELFNSSLSIKEQLDGIKTVLGKLIDQPDVLNKSRKDRHTSLLSHFYESPSFEGRRYYLKKKLEKFTVTSAQSTCEWYGGYLAEIDNDMELDFVRVFVRNSTFDFTWVSGSDEAQEDHWVHARNNKTVNYFSWGKNHCRADSIYNCMILDKTYDWYINCARCSSANTANSYVCEIPD